MNIKIEIDDTIADNIGSEENIKEIILAHLKGYYTSKVADEASKQARDTALLSVSDIDTKIL